MPDRWFPSIGITVSYFPECWFPKARTLVSRVPEYSVDGGQFIRPGRVSVGERRCLCRSIHIIIDLCLGEDVSTGVITVSFRELIGRIHGLGQLAILVVSISLLCRTIPGARDPVLGVIGVDHVEGGIVRQCDVLFRVIAVSRRERRAVVKAHCFRGHIIAVVVREAVDDRVVSGSKGGRAVCDLA